MALMVTHSGTTSVSHGLGRAQNSTLTLFRSASVLRVVSLLFLNEDRAFTLSEVENSLAGATGRRTVIRALGELVEAGFVERRDSRGSYPRYRANRANFLFEELRSIAIKTLGGFGTIVDAIDRSDEVVGALVFGSFAHGRPRADSDIDLLLVVWSGDTDRIIDLLEALSEASDRIGRRIEPIVVTVQEWIERAAADDPFVRRVTANLSIVLKGSLP